MDNKPFSNLFNGLQFEIIENCFRKECGNMEKIIVYYVVCEIFFKYTTR